MRGRKLVRVHGKQNGSKDGGRGGEGGGGGRGGETERRRMKDERRRQRRRGKGMKKKKNKKIDLLIKLYFSTMKILAQRPTHIYPLLQYY